jgi:hypothetical protein
MAKVEDKWKALLGKAGSREFDSLRESGVGHRHASSRGSDLLGDGPPG